MTSNFSTKPFLKWVGGKSQLISHIHTHLPKSFDVYFEPFVGGGAVYFSLGHLFKQAHISDVNEELINTYKVVKDNLDELIVELGVHKNTEQAFYNIRDVDRTATYLKWTNVQKAARFIYLNKTCFNGLYRVNSKGQFNTPFGKYTNPKMYRDWETDRKSTRLNSSHSAKSRMPSSA